MQAAPRVMGGGVRLELAMGVGRKLKENPSARDVSKEAETGLGVHIRVLKTSYLEVEQFERDTE